MCLRLLLQNELSSRKAKRNLKSVEYDIGCAPVVMGARGSLLTALSIFFNAFNCRCRLNESKVDRLKRREREWERRKEEEVVVQTTSKRIGYCRRVWPAVVNFGMLVNCSMWWGVWPCSRKVEETRHSKQITPEQQQQEERNMLFSSCALPSHLLLPYAAAQKYTRGWCRWCTYRLGLVAWTPQLDREWWWYVCPRKPSRRKIAFSSSSTSTSSSSSWTTSGASTSKIPSRCS